MMIPVTLMLETNYVTLRPLSENDYDSFLKLARDDEQMWEYFSLNLANEDQLKTWMDAAIAERSTNTRIPFTIIDKETKQIAGSTSLGNISMHDLRAEIGWSWLGKEFRSIGVNKHAKFAMMMYVFEALKFERLEFKTDVLNARARKGLQNIGATEEAVLRSHMTMWNSRRRDSIFYSVLKSEWPLLKETVFKKLL